MRRKNHKWIWLVAAALAAAGYFLLRPRAVKVDVGRAERGPMTVTVEEEGETRIHDHYIISSPVTGRLLRVDLEAGDSVAAGQIVARVVPAPLEPRQRAELEAQLRAAEATTNEAMAQEEKARNEREQARRDLARAEKLAASGVTSKEAFERAQTAEASAAKVLDAAQERLRAARSQQEAAKARLLEAELGKRAGAVISVRSPLKGKVLRLLQQSERVVTAGTPLLDLGYSPQLEVVTDVLSTEAVKVRAGDPVLLEGWGGAKPIRGRVRLVEPSGFTKISALGIEEQRVNVVIDFVDPPGPLGDAYRVEARITVWEAKDALKVPASALFRHGQAWAVFAVENGRARLKTVEIGHSNAAEAEVKGGIGEGAMVILHPTNQIRDGLHVEAR